MILNQYCVIEPESAGLLSNLVAVTTFNQDMKPADWRASSNWSAASAAKPPVPRMFSFCSARELDTLGTQELRWLESL
jgi:hypothetical protein